MNKKASDRLISVYWFALLFIIAAGIVYMVAIFYGTPYDVRKIEAEILADRISDCLSEGGYLKQGLFDSGNFSLTNDNLLDKCNLNFNVEDFREWKNDQYFLSISFYDFKTKNILFQDIYNGNINLKDSCGKKNEKNLPVCIVRDLYVLDKNKNSYVVKITAIVRKTEKNAI